MIRLHNGRAEAEVALLGAELRRWSVDGTPLLWTPDADIWTDVAPILFPVVGWTRGAGIVVDGVSYPLGVHGFARHLDFDIAEQSPTHVRLVARASGKTRVAYPFDWGLQVDHEVRGALLETRLTIDNPGERPMPYACGVHPGFCWPFAGGQPDDYAIVFDEREAASVPIISSDGLFTRQRRRVPMDGRRLPLCEALMSNEALCFIDARSKGLRFAHRSGAAIDVVFDDLPHIALWSRPSGPFLSIEGWTGHGDFVDGDRDLYRRPSMRHLPPGTTASHAATFTFVAPHLEIERSRD